MNIARSLFSYLYPNQALPARIYIPWIVSSYNSQQEQNKWKINVCRLPMQSVKTADSTSLLRLLREEPRQNSEKPSRQAKSSRLLNLRLSSCLKQGIRNLPKYSKSEIPRTASLVPSNLHGFIVLPGRIHSRRLTGQIKPSQPTPIRRSLLLF